MIYVGLTGGVCSGKSLAAHYFEQLGCGVIDLDALAKEVSQPRQNAYTQIVQQFGRGILQSNGEGIDRKKLRQIIFDDEGAKKMLENIVLPELERLESDLVQKLTAEGKKVIVTHGATIVESGWYEKYHKIVVLSVPRETQLSRLMARDNMDENTALKIISSQTTNENREQHAHVVIHNNGDQNRLRDEVNKTYALLVR